MRTLQEKYKGINEGKFTKEQFLRDARMEQPNLVTRFNGYDDAVQILKNRGMIVEAKSITEFSPYGSIAFSGEKEKEKETAPLSSLEVGDLVYVQGVSGDNIIVKDKRGDGTVGVGHPHNDKVSYQDGAKEVQVVKRAKIQEARLTKNNLTDYRYKATNDMDKYPYEQILRGLRVELEGLSVLGTPTPEEYTKALGKVLKNLEKDSIFYTNQVAGVKANKKRTDLMVDATPKNEVDKENGLQKAALKEAIKGVIKNILSEGVNLSPEGPQMFEDEVYEMQGPKTEAEYVAELDDYLNDNQMQQIKGELYTILTDPNEETVGDKLWSFLEDYEKVEHYRNLMAIFRDYANKDYPEDDEIDYDDENFSDPFIDGDLEEAADSEADRNMVRKLMTMYEADPSKYEKLHKEAEVMARTEKDIKYKHVLSLIVRAKAGALQRLADQDDTKQV